MTLNDGMGYDTHQPRPRRLPVRLSPRLIVAAIVAVAVVGLILTTLTSTRAPTPADPGVTPATPSASATHVPPAKGPTPTPIPTRTSGGHDAEERAGAPQEVWATFEAFMGAWCSTDPTIRRQGFAATATTALAEGLAETRPENVITAARTKVEVVGAGPHSAEFRVWFEHVATSVHVVLIADPGSPDGWRVTRIEKRGD